MEFVALHRAHHRQRRSGAAAGVLDYAHAWPQRATSFANSGHICSAGTRLFVEQRVYDAFVDCVASFGKGLRVGNGLDPETDIGPLVSEQQLDRVTDYPTLGREERAKAVTGGARLTDGPLANGYFVPPTVFADVRDEMRIAREEIFGPVISAIPFTDMDDLIERANGTMFGLGSGVWTRDVSKAHRLDDAWKKFRIASSTPIGDARPSTAS